MAVEGKPATHSSCRRPLRRTVTYRCGLSGIPSITPTSILRLVSSSSLPSCHVSQDRIRLCITIAQTENSHSFIFELLLEVTSFTMGDPISQSKERAAFPSKPNGEMNGHSNGHSALNIIDIRSDKEELSLGEVLRTCLKHDGSDGGERTLPDLLLWDAEGLKLFEQITYLPSYYLTNQEIELLEQSADSIAEAILPGSSMMCHLPFRLYR